MHPLRAIRARTERYSRWMLFLAFVGAFAIVSVVATLFLSFGRRAADLREDQAPAVESQEFLAAVAATANAPLLDGGTVRLLMDGDGFYPRLLEVMRGAQKSINFSVYIWEDGQVSDQILPVLAERARAGVQVRVLLDGLGAMKKPDDKFEELEKAGVRVFEFRAPRLGKLTRAHKRNHRRSIVIDGLVGFTGGMAVGDKWLGHAQSPENWRDSMVEVTGPMATSVQSAFVANWAHSTGEMLVGPSFFPPPAPQVAASEAGGLQPVTRHTGIASAPSSEDHPLRLLYMQSFVSARKRLYLTTPYFIPDPALRRALVERAKAGVDVRVLSNSDHTDAKPIRSASHAYFEELLEGGVRIYEYEATMIHTKHLVVDGVWSVVGSPNMDVRSKELNQENVLGILDAGLGQEMERVFILDLTKSREIKLDEWRQRGPWKRLTERFFTLFENQY
jgi:cardiolipin synthase